MIEKEFDTIVNGRHYPIGSESRVYVLPEELSKHYGEPCVIKIYTEGATMPVYSLEERVRHDIPGMDQIPIDRLGDHERDIGRGLKNLGLSVPEMYQSVVFESPFENSEHYVGGKSVSAVVMSQFNDMRDFEDLHENEHPVALGSFVKGIATAMYGGYRPTDETCHDLNTVYDSNGKVTFFDFSQWRMGDPLNEQDVMDFLKIERVLPEKAWEMDLIF